MKTGASTIAVGGRVIDPVLTDSVAPVDRKLASWFDEVKNPPATPDKKPIGFKVE